MFQDAFDKLELPEITTILDQVNPELGNISFDPNKTTIMAHDVSFYPGFRFLDISDHSVIPVRQRLALYSEKQNIILNFTNEPIYKLNQELPIKLSKKNIVDYVRFFFTCVRGRHGRFLISESIDDINWKEEPPPTARKAIGKILKPITLQKVGRGGVYNLKATMIFKDSLFGSDINVSSDGFVTLDNEELLIEDIPITDDIFGQ